MDVSKGFNSSANSILTSLDITNLSTTDKNLTEENGFPNSVFFDLFFPTDYIFSTNDTLDIFNNTNDAFNITNTKSSSEDSGNWLENLVDKLKKDPRGKPLLYLVMMVMSFFTEAMASFHKKIKEKPLFRTPIPMLTTILHNTSCTGVHSVKSTVQSMVMSVFIQVDPWICLSIVSGTAVGQLVCNWTDPNKNMDENSSNLSKKLPSDTDLNLDMDLFQDIGRRSPLGQENTAKLLDRSPKVVKQSFINSSTKIPFTKITLPDFRPTPSKPPPLPDTPPKDSKPVDVPVKESEIAVKEIKPSQSSPPPSSKPMNNSAPQSPKPADIKSPIRYQKPIYGSMDSGVSMEPLTKPSTGPNRELRSGSNPYHKFGPSPSRSKGPDEKLLLGNRLAPRTLSATESKIFQQGTPVSSFIGGTRVYRAGSNPDLRLGRSQAVSSNPALYSGPSSNTRAVSNPDLRIGLASSKRIGPIQSLQSGPSSQQRAGPNRNLRGGPRSTLSVGSNPNLRSGPDEMRRAQSNSDLASSSYSMATHNQAFDEGDKLNDFTDNNIVIETEIADRYTATGLSEVTIEQRTKQKPIPRKRSSLEDKARPRPVVETKPDASLAATWWDSSVDANKEFSYSGTKHRYDDRKPVPATSNPSSSIVVDERSSLSRAARREINKNSSQKRRSSSRRKLPIAPDDDFNTDNKRKT